MDPTMQNVAAKANLETMNKIGRVCTNKCLGDYSDSNPTLKEEKCIENCISLAQKFHELANKVFEDESLKKISSK